MKKVYFGLFSLFLIFVLAGVVSAAVNAVTPSTNDANRTNGWAYVEQLSQGVGTTELQFTSTRGFASCFEYRTDGDTSQIVSTNGGVNWNTEITDGLYPSTCVNNQVKTKSIVANNYVEIRMVFGAEKDERFDWTRFEVTPAPAELSGTLSAEDFGVIKDYNNGQAGQGLISGYATGFGLKDATFTGATSVVVQLFAAGNQLLQTNTAVMPKFGNDVTGTQFSSPFDVSGAFDYLLDGYWTNARETQYGQSVPATKVVATVTLANTKVVTAENNLLAGDPTTIYLVLANVTTNPATPVALTSATVHGTNGPVAADDTSFWFGTTVAGPFTPSTDPASELPSGWSGVDSFAQSANAAFSYDYTGLTPNTTYYFVAWSLVGGTWYPGEVLNFTTESETLPPSVRTAEITSPTAGQNVYGLVNFTAYLNDDDADPVQWAVRSGTCSAGTGTVFGNVDGHSDVATINSSNLSNQTFSFSKNMSSLAKGMYCFVYNPSEDSGEADIRKTVEFNLVQTPDDHDSDNEQCKNDRWKNLFDFRGLRFKNQGDCVSDKNRSDHGPGQIGGHRHVIGEVEGAYTSIYEDSNSDGNLHRRILALMTQYLSLLQGYQNTRR